MVEGLCMGRYRVALSRRIRPGMEEAFEAAIEEFARRSLHAPGTTVVRRIGAMTSSHSN